MIEDHFQKRCTNCGAVAEFPDGALSIMCGYCDSPMVDSEAAAPQVDLVAPFRIEKSVAEQKLKEHLAGRFWAPDSVRKGIVKDHRLRGVLVPFWAYTGVGRSNYKAKVGVYYYVTRTTTVNGKTQTRRERRTEWFRHWGSSICAIEHHLVSASSGIEEEESNRVEPFDCGRALPYDARLLSGFEAELPSIPRENADPVAMEEIRGLEARRVEKQLLPGDVGSVEEINTNVDVDKVEMVLLPLWIATWRHEGKLGRQIVNGQTGKVIGDVPVSKTKIAVAVVGGLLVLFGLLAAMGAF